MTLLEMYESDIEEAIREEMERRCFDTVDGYLVADVFVQWENTQHDILIDGKMSIEIVREIPATHYEPADVDTGDTISFVGFVAVSDLDGTELESSEDEILIKL